MRHIKHWEGTFVHEEQTGISYIVKDDDAVPVNVIDEIPDTSDNS